ncbi:Na+/proline symporter [Hyella patelloides LEGE 07179]|uniref:Na+/proline symporter n=1 Tax=Hyella patelloides LEGE 07179 TaxID=945734 RepID=A0A563VLS9_9CYAN|nr:sodium:solute symporter family protein [Hyella patelloides]VEP12317.1 Na+/proline symporter [Hyella patelloides LEGE 07179]
MQLIDWLIVIFYFVFTMGLGLYLSRRAAQSLEDFFISGRSLSWWLAGTSMAATTFSVDTPLIICGIVSTRGIAGNWEWWNFGIAHVILIYIFARLWRRSEIVTDAELTEIRYGGKTAAILRATKAFLFAVPINCIGIGYAMLAMIKVVGALQLWESLGLNPGDNGKIWSVVAISLFVLLYSGFSGLWGVVATDFFQFFLGLFGAIAVAIVAVNHVGGIHQLIPKIQKIQQVSDLDILSFFPLSFDGGLNLKWNDAAGITATTFSAYVFLQWWSFRRSDGGGEFIQRIAASKDEAEAEKASWFFNVLHYVIRTWPWIIVALVAMVIYPDLEDPELGYPKLMLDFLPPVMLGLVVSSLIAAFMSTVSTSINWGASYLTNDLYLRFVRPNATQAELVSMGRMASVLVTLLGAIAGFYFNDIRTVFRLVIAIGTGPGLVLILRWFWWRINAAAELTAMLSGFICGLLTSEIPQGIMTNLIRVLPFTENILSPILQFQTFLNEQLFADFGTRLLIISSVTSIAWIAAMYLTPPESDEVLEQFYLRVRPGGIGWRKQRKCTGVAAAQNLTQDFSKVIAAILLLFGSMFTVGGFLLLQPLTGWICLILTVVSGFWLRRLNKLSVT